MTGRLQFRYHHDRGPSLVASPALGFARLARALAVADAAGGEPPILGAAQAPSLLAGAIATGAKSVPGRLRLRGIATMAGEPLLALDYDGRDRLVRIDQPGGCQTMLSWDDAGRLLAVHDEAGCAVRCRHHGAGPLAQLEYPGRQVFEYGYDAAHRLVSCSLPDGRTVRYSYHGQRPFLSRIESGGHCIEHPVHGDGRLRAVEVHVHGSTTVLDACARTVRVPVWSRQVLEGTVRHCALGVIEERNGQLTSTLSLTGALAVRAPVVVTGAGIAIRPVWSVAGQEDMAVGADGRLRWLRDALGRRTVLHRLDERRAVAVRIDGVGVVSRSRLRRSVSMRTDTLTMVTASSGSHAAWVRDSATGMRWHRDASRGCTAIAVPGLFAGAIGEREVRLRPEGMDLVTAAGELWRLHASADARLPWALTAVFAPLPEVIA